MFKQKLLIYASFLMGLSLLFLSSCEETNKVEDQTLIVSGIEFTPNCFIQDGKAVGIDVDIASEVMQENGIGFSMKIEDTWESAYNATLKGPNRALLTVGYSDERKDLFKWAGPISQGIYGVFGKGVTNPKYPISIDEAKQLEEIAVVRGWLETTTLENMGFTNLVYYDSYSAAITAFMNDEVKYISSDFYHLVKSLPSGYFMEKVCAITRYRTVYYYIAFSKDVDDAIVAKCQTSIEKMIRNQTTYSIVQKYLQSMPSDYIPGAIQLFTEVLAPNSYYTGVGADRKIIGSSVDIVNEIQKRNGYVDKINMSTWTDAYSTVLYLPNSALFTTSRTPEREKLFQWVGPIDSYSTCFFTLSSSGIKIATLEQAKALKSIATPKGWYSYDYLVSQGFTNIIATATTSQDAYNQLVDGEVDALFLNEKATLWLSRNSGKPEGYISKQLETMNSKGYIAFSLSTPKTVVDQWQTNLNAMRSDGTFKSIWEQWYPGIALP